MRLIWLLLKESRFSVVLIMITGLASGSCTAQLIILINRGISESTTINLILSFIFFVAATLLTGTISQFFLIKIAQDAVYKLRIGLSREILSAPLLKLEELGANRLLATLTSDVQSISNSVFAIPFVCIDVGIIVGCFFYLIWLSETVFLLTLIFLVLAVTVIQVLLSKALKNLALEREEEDQIHKHFRAITEGTKELKLNILRREAFFEKDLNTTALISSQLRTKALRIFAIASGGGQFFFFTVLGLVVFSLPSLISLPPITITTYVVTMTYLLVPIQNLMDRLPALLRANVALQKVEQMGLILSDQAELPFADQLANKKQWTKLELSQITHTYRNNQGDSQFSLGELDLAFYSGQLIFIIGGNGSGKSTLVKLITGLYVPESGTIKLDNIMINDDNREWYRQQFSVVFSDFYLFNRLHNADENEIDIQSKFYLKQFQLDEKVKVENGKISTTALSQGQRKRLALLTAYLEDRPIYIFDEWAADQEPFFRNFFYEQLLPTLKENGKMVIVISHDDRYFHIADRLIKLDYGSINYKF